MQKRRWSSLATIIIVASLLSPSRTSAQPLEKLAILLSHSSSAELYGFDTTNHSLQLVAQDMLDVQPAWSPDHQQIAIAQATTAGDIQIAVMNANGSNRHPIYTISHSQISGVLDLPIRHIVWSPDGQRIAFDVKLSDPQEFYYLYIIDTKGNLIQTVGPSALLMVISRWLPDTNEIAYIVHNGSCDAFYVYNLNTHANRFWLGCSNSEDVTPSVSCTGEGGRLLTYAWSSQYLAARFELTSARSCGDVIVVAKSDSKSTVTLPYKAKQLTWSPDGQSIGYIQDVENGAFCIVSISGTGNRCGPAMADSVWQVVWVQDNTIAFVAVDGEATSGYTSQLCTMSSVDYAKHCLTDGLPGVASIIE